MGSKPNTPSPPDYTKLIREGYKANLEFAPKLTQKDLELRKRFDPQLIAQQMGIQEQFDPRLAQEQYDALQRRDPQAVRAHQLFGDRVAQALERGYIDPTRAGAYKALGQQVTGDTLRGATMDPETLRQTTQAIMSRSPGLSYGEAQNMATAVYTGQRGQQLKAQRQQANLGFLGQQSEADLAMTAGGRYAGTPGLVQMENQIGGVQAPRGLGYLNPNAGAQSAQFGLQNYQNQLASNQLSGGSSNPWSSALGTVGGIVGSYYGGPAGGAAGQASGNYVGSLFG